MASVGSARKLGQWLLEELDTDTEDMAKTRHPKIFIGKIDFFPMEKVVEGLNSLAECTDTSSTKEVRDALGKVVPEMRDS